MQIKRLLAPSLALSAVLVVTAFGSNGFKNLFTTQINPAEAAVPSAAQPAAVTLATGSVTPISGTVSVVEFVPAPELPNRAPAAIGVVSSREGNNLTLQSFLQVIAGTQSSAVSRETAKGMAPGDPAQAGVTVLSGSATLAGATASQGQQAELKAASRPGELQILTVTGQGALAPTGAVSAAPGGTSAAILVGPGLPAQATPLKVAVTKTTKVYRDVTPMGQLPAGGNQTIRQTLEAGSLDGLMDKMVVTVWGHMDAGQLTADVIVYQTQLPN